MSINDTSRTLSRTKRLKCMLLAPLRGEFQILRRTISSAASDSRVELTSVNDFPPTDEPINERVFSEILRADFLIAVLTDLNANVYYEVGLAHATGKPVIFLTDKDTRHFMFNARSNVAIFYENSPHGMAQLRSRLRRLLMDFRKDARRFTTFSQLTPSLAGLPIVDLEKLEPREFENLCFELLTQMGYRRVEWGKQLEEIDVVATLPKKDPDGFEYDELWLISMGLRAPSEILLDMAMSEPRYLLRQLKRADLGDRFKPDAPVTLLLILLREFPNAESVQHELKRAERRLSENSRLRLRIWDRALVTSLIRQYPQLAHKYFSEEGRAQSTSRKSVEQLYLENMRLTEMNQATINALKEEEGKRARAERDAVWKDVAFTAAHKLGNPIFALETNLQGLKRKIATQPDEARARAADMDASIETAKVIIEQFKSLTRAQQITRRPIDLLPLIKTASCVAENSGVHVTISADKRLPQVYADPVRMTECFDELFANALHWLNKTEKRITVSLAAAKKEELPPNLDEGGKYIKIRFEDNGCGIPLDMKEQVFFPFYSTYPHGTGLGLSLVQRIIEGHDGAIRELGKVDEGAVFEIFLPQAGSKQ